MKSVVFALGLAALSALPACSAKEVSVHDPVMAKEGDTWYLFSTGPGITFYSSKNMKDWTPEGRIFAGPAGLGQECGAWLRWPCLGAGCAFP
jgi:arabinan endo-1,5-alpha-L-arabinosidase